MHLGNSRWTYPLFSAGVCVAALLVPWMAGKATFSAGFVVAAGALAALLGHLVGSREDGLRALSSVDVLTGLFNRRFFELTFERELARAARHRTSLALLVIDVDGLKGINDRLGHTAGDRAIRAVGDALRHCLRAGDLASRWGGDELVVVAPCTDELAARALAERIVSTVALRTAARRPVGEPTTTTHAPTVTVSVGVAAAGPETAGQLRSDLLFAAADRALYEAKGLGPGRVQSASGEGKSMVRGMRGPLHLVVPSSPHALAGGKRRTSG